ncbi:hypothetical protein B5E80_17970 [Flavonifractor sp. An135]|nr:hypothetical protein [Flavonifractor sp. An135]OUQ18616.1 hypothetical protein B5E80_17970 [Flavonifractor sp. An135]
MRDEKFRILYFLIFVLRVVALGFVASISYGKDSLAMLEAIHRLGLTLTRIISVKEWATDEVRAVLPEVAAFEDLADGEIYRRYGIHVEGVRSEYTFEDLFYGKMGARSSRPGQIRGWPYRGGCWVNSYLKMEPFRKELLPGDVCYIGIAANEAARIRRHEKRPGVRMPLVEIGWTEEDCFRWCKAQGLLSPAYQTFARDGCWFCMNQSVERLRWLRREHRPLWRMMKKWDRDSPVKFSPKYTVEMLERRFRAEERGTVPSGSEFRWEMLHRKHNGQGGRA